MYRARPGRLGQVTYTNGPGNQKRAGFCAKSGRARAGNRTAPTPNRVHTSYTSHTLKSHTHTHTHAMSSITNKLFTPQKRRQRASMPCTIECGRGVGARGTGGWGQGRRRVIGPACAGGGDFGGARADPIPRLPPLPHHHLPHPPHPRCRSQCFCT